MKLLDLFCGAGGCSMGYHRAGFDVVGVDNELRPRYPFEFHHGDALAFLAEHGHEFDAIHASPPCQKHCGLKHLSKKTRQCWVAPTRIILKHLGIAWIMENVVGSPLENPVQLCGSAFGLKVRRHRLFESSLPLWGVGCDHKSQGRSVGVYGTGGRRINRKPGDKGGNLNMARNIAEAREAMGIDWMTREELSQAIPPAYTEYLGKQLLSHLKQRESVA